MSMKAKESTYLSKSLFMKGLQCRKSLYLHKFHPELRDEVSESQEALFQSGREVGAYARQLFPGGFEVPYEDLSMEEQLNLTGEKIKGGARILYELAFSYDNVFVKADILRKARQGWELYEVKGSTKMKEEHLNDVAAQYYVLKGAGIRISKASVVYLNNQYVRNGDIDPSALFVIVDVTKAVRDKERFVADEIADMRKALRKGVPDIDIGERCAKPYYCDFYEHCWQHIPEDSIFSLRGRGPNKFDLYKRGIVHLCDVPEDILPQNQRIQWQGTVEKKNVINKKGVKEFLDCLWYPLYFLDFETTFMVPIPMFDGTSPYQQVPFQYSLHYLQNENAELGHYEYLASANIDPRKELIEKLLNEIPEDACVLAYNQGFETKILNCLKEWFPVYGDRIDRIIRNIRDLMVPFERKDIYRWEFEGSYSLKNVLPVMVPELSYRDMEVSGGAMASNAYLRMWELQDSAEIDKIRKALLDYCKLDTLGMVRILERLRKMV